MDPEKAALLQTHPSAHSAETVTSSNSIENDERTKSRRSTKVLFAVLSLLALKSLVLAGTYFYFDANPVNYLAGNIKDQQLCPQPGSGIKPSNWSSLYDYSGFPMESAKRLSGAVKVPTQSFDDMGNPGEDSRWAPFVDLRKYLKETFPIVHEFADLELINSHSMLFTLKGKSETLKSLKPFLFLAHLDVVPATTSLDRWTYPPFDGVIDGDWVYGRGTSDCKNNVVGILTALEFILKNGWQPNRTFLLAFGQDEEVGGPRGAEYVSVHLEERYGKDSIAMIVDEGGMGIQEQFGTEFALPGIAEKGYGNFMIEVDTLGGHSSIPLSKHTSIGILAKIISAIEDDDTFVPDLQEESPIWSYLQCVGTHGKPDQVPKYIKKAVRSRKPDLEKVGEEFARQSLPDRYLIETSKAVTVITGGNKVNALPESALVTINSRIDIFSSVEEVVSAYSALITPIAKKFSFTFNGQSYTPGPSAGNITLIVDQPGAPSPISPVDSVAFQVFAKAVKASFGQEVVTAPSAMTGNTDCRHYTNLTKNIYRWSPTRVGTRLNAHTVDEKIQIKTHVEGIKFYTELIVQVDEAGVELA